MEKNDHTVSLTGVVLLIAGATIGAGILGLPVQTGLSGFLPSVFGIIIIWLFMTITALILAERFIKDNNLSNDYPTVFKEDFGIWGKIFSVLGYLINYYSVMIAYLCASISIIQYLMPIKLPPYIPLLIFFIPTALITLFGLKYVIKANFIFMCILFVSLTILIITSLKDFVPDRLAYTDWKYMLPAMPVILNAFLFHNIIPPVCRGLKNNKRKIKKSIIFGTSIACLINLFWLLVGIGSFPMAGSGEGNMLYAFTHGEPATVPLSIALNSKTVTIVGMVFSLAAVFTSFVSVVIGLRGFLSDLLSSTFQINNQFFVICLTLLPSFCIALIYPDFFIGALDLAGGIGGVLIFGVFPALLIIKYSKRKVNIRSLGGVLLVIIFVFLISFEILQQFNTFKIKPRIESKHQGYKLKIHNGNKKNDANHSKIKKIDNS